MRRISNFGFSQGQVAFGHDQPPIPAGGCIDQIPDQTRRGLAGAEQKKLLHAVYP